MEVQTLSLHFSFHALPVSTEHFVSFQRFGYTPVFTTKGEEDENVQGPVLCPLIHYSDRCCQQRRRINRLSGTPAASGHANQVLPINYPSQRPLPDRASPGSLGLLS